MRLFQKLFFALLLMSMTLSAYDSHFEYADGKTTPDFEFVDGDGRLKSIASYKGKVVFLKVWSITCGPCLGEMPFVDNMTRQFSDDDLEVIPLNVDPRIRLDGLKEFYKEKQYRYIDVFYDGGQASKKALGWTGYPTIFIFDRDGNLIGSRAGMGRWDGPEALKFMKAIVQGKRPKVAGNAWWKTIKSWFIPEQKPAEGAE